MWTRGQLKENGKANFKKNYWKCVVAALVLSLAAGGGGGASSRASSDQAQGFGDLSPEVIAAIAVAVCIIVVVATVISIFLLKPLEVGGQRFFIVNRQTAEGADFGELAFGFKSNYLNVVKTLFLRDLFLVFWTLLFFIPGIIKTYSYRFVPYIMAENPNMPATEAITLSRKMMNGHKWEAFVLDLSFIGWILLTVITCTLAGIFYVFPYIYATQCEFYTAVKENYVTEGATF